MKRDWDTIRDILIRLEDKGPDEDSLELSNFPAEQRDEVLYHVELLEEADLIHGKIDKQIGPVSYNFIAVRLTWEGHELPDAIRSDTIWNKTKESFVSKGISMTCDLVKSVAIGLATDFLQGK